MASRKEEKGKREGTETDRHPNSSLPVAPRAKTVPTKVPNEGLVTTPSKPREPHGRHLTDDLYQ